MKQTSLLLIAIAAAGALSLGACKEKKKAQEPIIISREEPRKPKAPIRMQDYRQEVDAKWLGRTYHIEVLRMPSDSLPMVSDEIGQKYVDNRISLKISREDGSVFLQKTYTKAAFQSYLDDDFRRTGILEAMIFEEVDDNRLEFAVSVVHPQSEDEFIPLKMTIDRMGEISVKRDTDIDTNGYDNDGDDDDDGV